MLYIDDLIAFIPRHGVPGTIFKEGLSWRTHQVCQLLAFFLCLFLSDAID